MEQQNFKIFIGGLSKKTNEQSLLNHLQEYGEILSLNLKKKKSSQDCVGYGHATVHKETYLAMIDKGCSKFKGNKITFGPYLDGNNLKSHLEKLNSKRIFVRGIPISSTGSSLESLFSNFGAVETAYLRAVPGKKTPIGVVLFVNPKAAEETVKVINDDKEGAFKDMNATYKFLQKRRDDTREKFSGAGLDSRSGRSWESQGRDLKPGKKGYNRERLIELNHNYGNLMLNEGYRSKAVDQRLFKECQNEFDWGEMGVSAFDSHIGNSQNCHFHDAPARVRSGNRLNGWVPRLPSNYSHQHSTRFYKNTRSSFNNYPYWNTKASMNAWNNF